uniref:BLE2 protein n=1 Tax=Hordeum vulgare subsp. vulgare TaxID=112509 RepID=A0A8I6WRV2_HORVV
MFTRNNRMDYQIFFNTRGAFRPVGWNGLVAVLCFLDIFVILWKKDYLSDTMILSMVIILVTGRFLSGLKLHICNPLHRAISLWSPLVAILLTAPPLSNQVNQYTDGDDYDHDHDPSNERISPTSWIVFTALLVPVLLVTISRLRFSRIIRLADSILGSKQEICHRIVINLCMIAALGMQVYMLHLDPFINIYAVVIIQVCALVVESFGNFQVPAAVLRICLASLSLQHRYKNGEDQNLVASLRIFYWMVLGQGVLYAVACMLKFFSFIPRRFLVHCGGFRGYRGVESVDLYYAYALEKCMQEGVLAPKKISLSSFAIDSLNSDSPMNQLQGIRVMHSFLQWGPTKAQLLSTLTTSTKAVDRIIRMLDRTSPEDTDIRIYAAKVTSELAKNLRLVTIPGTIQLVSALLDTGSRLKRGNPLLDTYDEQEERDDPVLNTEDSQQAADNQMQRQSQLLALDTENRMQTQTNSTEQVGTYEQKSCMLRCWQRISEFWSMPKDQLLTDQDLLPALAMSIIDSLASCDQDICVKISKADDLIPKIIGFTSYRSDTMNTEAQQKILLKSSLKVLQRLTSIGGEIGITLRYKISKHPFLLSNLSDILGDNSSSQDSGKLVAAVLRNIAIDEKTRQDIGCVQLIITRLVQAFLGAEGTTSTNADHLLRKVAGQALAMLTIESAYNCLVILKEPEFMKELKIMIHDKKYIYVAASLLRNLCMHARSELKESDLKELSHTLGEVLERIMNADGAELEILIGLSSQTCKVIPEDFTQQLDNDDQIKQRFLKRLVHILNANMKPSAHYPGIRRVVLEQVIHLTERNSLYADCFNELKIMEALSRVEQTVSKAENYKLFMGDAGFMEYSTPMSALVARAKELMSRD